MGVSAAGVGGALGRGFTSVSRWRRLSHSNSPSVVQHAEQTKPGRAPWAGQWAGTTQDKSQFGNPGYISLRNSPLTPTREAPTGSGTLEQQSWTSTRRRSPCPVLRHSRRRVQSQQRDKEGWGLDRGWGDTRGREESRGAEQKPQTVCRPCQPDTPVPNPSLPLAPRSTKPKPSWSRFCRMATLSSMT